MTACIEGGGPQSAISLQRDSICRAPRPCSSLKTTEGLTMLKNILAAVGIVVIAKKGYEVYQQYKSMEAEIEILRKTQGES